MLQFAIILIQNIKFTNIKLLIGQAVLPYKIYQRIFLCFNSFLGDKVTLHDLQGKSENPIQILCILLSLLLLNYTFRNYGA